jgi:hypothetical protein
MLGKALHALTPAGAPFWLLLRIVVGNAFSGIESIKLCWFKREAPDKKVSRLSFEVRTKRA